MMTDFEQAKPPANGNLLLVDAAGLRSQLHLSLCLHVY